MPWYFIPNKAFPYECSNCGYGHSFPDDVCELCGEVMIEHPEPVSKERWVVCFGSRPSIIVSSRTDAEEYALSICEERAYEKFLLSDTYLQDMKNFMDKTNESRRHWSSCQPFICTLNGYILSYCGNDIHIFKVGELE